MSRRAQMPERFGTMKAHSVVEVLLHEGKDAFDGLRRILRVGLDLDRPLLRFDGGPVPRIEETARKGDVQRRQQRAGAT
jgi:hypothetical protein